MIECGNPSPDRVATKRQDSLDSGECCSTLYSSGHSQDSYNTFGTSSSWGLHRASTSSCLTGGTAAITDDALSCHEDLQLVDEDAASFGGPCTTQLSNTLPTIRYSPGVVDSEVLRNELEQEVGCQARRSRVLAREMRSRAISWLVEVATELELQSGTLSLAVYYFDKFLELSKVVPPGTMLQLLALACVSIAAKQEEVKQRVSQQWLALARGEDNQLLFMKEDLVKMEWLVLETLEWRTRVPTVHTFLQLFLPSVVWCAPGIPNEDLKQRVADVAALLTELSMLDDGLLEYSYSTVAAASLVLAEYLALRNPPTLVTKEQLGHLLSVPHDDLRECVTVLHALFLDATINGVHVMAPSTMRFRAVLTSAGFMQQASVGV